MIVTVMTVLTVSIAGLLKNDNPSEECRSHTYKCPRSAKATKELIITGRFRCIIQEGLTHAAKDFPEHIIKYVKVDSTAYLRLHD